MVQTQFPAGVFGGANEHQVGAFVVEELGRGNGRETPPVESLLQSLREIGLLAVG